MYRRPYNPNTGTYGASPKHDEASHAADSFGGGVQAPEKGLIGMPVAPLPVPKPFRPGYLRHFN
jgi:hypothetical protein